MNYWYRARPHEIFLDLDSNRAVARALSVLRIAIRKKHLPIESIWLYSTPTKGHAHLIIALSEEWSRLDRVAWSLWLGNDRLRCAYILRRSISALPEVCMNADILTSKYQYYRGADAWCECKEKHKPKKITEKCPAMKHLLGEERSADYFTRTGSRPPKKKIRVPWGKVSLTQIRNWKEVYEG